ncbi:MAG: hypothetical protein ACTHK6_08550 [Solirubrobacterales bacterium]
MLDKTLSDSGSDANPAAVRRPPVVDSSAAALIPRRSPARPKTQQVEVQITEVPVQAIEDLDRAQQLLNKAIELAIFVSDARLKMVTASGSMTEILRNRVLQADMDKWEELSGHLRSIRPLPPWPTNGDDSVLAAPIERLGRTRNHACERAEEVVNLFLGADQASEPKPDVVTMRRAVKELQEAVDRCAEACADESRTLAQGIGYRVQAILDHLERQRGASTGQASPRSEEVKARPESRGTESTPNLAKAKDDISEPDWRE